jgi:DNA repair protein RecO (recombination protein O)
MHHWTDEALILAVDKFGDYDAIVHVFTPAQGLARGVVKRGLTSKKRPDMQPATLVEVNWSARLEQHMGTITLEAKHSYATRVMADPLKLAAVGSAMGLLRATLAEHDPHPELYHAAHHFLQHVAAGVAPLVWLSEYVRLELALLELAGFGLDLSECAATGEAADLVYVSPKSGRAVSREAGAPYHDRLLALPEFIRDGHVAEAMGEVAAGLALTGQFFETRLLPELHRTMPPLRAHFSALVLRLGAAA